MASIDRRGSKWVVRYRDPEGKQRREPFPTLAAARTRRAEVEHTIAGGGYTAPSERRTTVAEMAEQWLAGGHWAPATRDGYERIVTKHVKGRDIGAMRVVAVRPSHVRAWLRQLADDGYEPNSLANYLNRLTSVFEAAVHDRIIGVSPCKGVSAPKVPLKRVVPLSDEQVAAIAAAMPERYQAIVWTGAMTGLRMSEVLGLTVDRLNLSEGAAWVTVDRQRTPKGVFGPTKTEASNREVPIPDRLVRELVAHMAQHAPSTEWVAGSRGVAGGSGHLFTGPTGRPVWHSNFYEAWNLATAKLGLPEDADTFHALRHHYASTLIRAGVDILAVKEILGHSSITETVDTYGHMFPSSFEAVRNAMSAKPAEAATELA